MASSVVEQIIATVYARLSGPTTAVGRRETEKHAAPRRIVAVPVGAPEISQPNRPGDARYSDKGRILLVRHFNIEWECHGVRSGSDTLDFAAAEALYLDTIIAVRNATHHSVSFSNERWLDQEEGQDSFERLGSVIKFTSTIQIPIYEARSVIVGLTGDPKIATTVTLNDNDEETINQGS